MNLKHLVEERIVVDDEICSGKPRIKGTRVTVADILLAISEGMHQSDILRNFRSLQTQDIQAAVAYAYCLTDNIKFKIKSSFGEQKAISGNSSAPTKHVDIAEQNKEIFTKALEEQAKAQEEMTKEKVKEIKSKKSKKSKAPTKKKKQAPKERPYDLLIDISQEESTKVFAGSDHIEQALDMEFDNYVFEQRDDGKPWLCYSSRDGIEIDPAMKRNLLVTYKSGDETKEAVFEGYLTSDRQHKVFLEKDTSGNTCGRAL